MQGGIRNFYAPKSYTSLTRESHVPILDAVGLGVNAFRSWRGDILVLILEMKTEIFEIFLVE